MCIFAMNDDDMVLIVFAIIVSIFFGIIAIFIILEIVNGILRFLRELADVLSQELRLPCFYMKKMFQFFGQIIYLPIQFFGQTIELLIQAFCKIFYLLIRIIFSPLEFLINSFCSEVELLFSNYKQHKEEAKNSDLELVNAVLDARLKIASQDPEGWKELHVLIYRFGQRRVNKILKMCNWNIEDTNKGK